ncbi:MAG: hypothetical protein R2705_17395 [Ilumatobacteraceae bacterium]
MAQASVHYRHRGGLKDLVRQYVLYGRGMTQVLAHHGLPGADGVDKPSGLRAPAEQEPRAVDVDRHGDPARLDAHRSDLRDAANEVHGPPGLSLDATKAAHRGGLRRSGFDSTSVTLDRSR